MRTAVAQTSIQAYHGIENLNEQEREVLTAIKVLGESCIADIAAYLNWQKSTVSARMNELKKIGAIVFVGKKKSETTGIMSEFYRPIEFKETLF